jgi:hypothetical protein
MNLSNTAKNILTLIFILAFSAAGYAEEKFISGVSKRGISSGPVSYKKMSARLDYDAVRFRKNAPVPRIAEHDSAFAADPEEYLSLNTYGVIMIAAQCHDPDELPFKSVYLKILKKHFPLTCLLSREVATGSEISARVLGSYRRDSFYLIPYGYSRLNAELCANWGKNRTGFILKKFPSEFKLDYINDGLSIKPVKGQKISRASLKLLLKREFSFTEEETDAANKALEESGL